MKMFNKITSLLMALPLVFAVSACSSEDYEAATVPSGAQVYISNELGSDIKITVSDTEIAIPVMRVQTAEALTVPVQVTFSEGAEECFTPKDTKVTFAEGEDKTTLVVAVNSDKIEFGTPYSMTVTLSDENNTTPYGISSATYTITMPAPWTSIGKGKVTDNYYFGASAVVEFFRSDLNPNLYRLKNPFPVYLKAEGEAINEGVTEYIYLQMLQPGDEVLGQTVEEEGLVFFYSDGPHNSVNTGYTHPTYDDDLCIVFPGIFSSLGDPSNWTHNRIIGYKDDGSVGCVQLAPYYYMFNTGGWNKTQEDGIFIVNFPGYNPQDFSVDLAFKGRMIDPKENGSAVFDITLGSDVAKAKAVMVPGKDPMVGYELIKSGDDAVKELTASGEVSFAYTEGGNQVLVVVVYDADGNEQGVEYTVINIPENGAQETYTAMFVGNYTHCVQSLSSSGTGVWSEGAEMINEGSILFGCDQDESKYMITPWVMDEGALVFTMDEEGNLTVDNTDTGYDNDGVNIAATDINTAGLANIPSYYSNGKFTFALAWHDLDDISAGFYGFTMDEFVLTAQVSNAPAKARSKINFTPAKSLKKTLARDTKAVKVASLKTTTNGATLR